jgi:Bacterial regulatory helix-turn-helix proteins, AraC family
MAHEITGRYAIVDRARAYYDVCGSGIPLVCIHMGWACSLQWHYFMPIMAAAGFKVIAPDLPGHAKSMPVNWKPFRKMRDYAEENIPISVLAGRLGYTSESAFSNAFKRVTGKAPKRYRTAARSGLQHSLIIENHQPWDPNGDHGNRRRISLWNFGREPQIRAVLWSHTNPKTPRGCVFFRTILRKSRIGETEVWSRRDLNPRPPRCERGASDARR